MKNNSKILDGEGKIALIECPSCKRILETNPSTLTYAFDVRIVKGSRRWKNDVKRHYGSFHPRDDINKAIKTIKDLKYGEHNEKK